MQLHAIVVTYRRPNDLGNVLARLGEQSHPPDTITVIDNDPLGSAAKALQPSQTLRYISSDRNLGPAGGLASGFKAVDRFAADDDCIIFVDDNDPPPTSSTLERLLAFRERCPIERNRLGAVGLAGGQYSRRTGMLRRLRDSELTGAVRVQYLGGGQYPVYSVRALRAVGGPRSDLFFGFEELELGLRLENQGFVLFGSGEIWSELRAEHGRRRLNARQAAAGRSRSPWRRYYSVRNLVWISRAYGGVGPAVICTARSGLGGALRDATSQRSIRAMAPALRGVCHGWIGRLGITMPISEAV